MNVNDVVKPTNITHIRSFVTHKRVYIEEKPCECRECERVFPCKQVKNTHETAYWRETL